MDADDEVLISGLGRALYEKSRMTTKPSKRVRAFILVILFGVLTSTGVLLWSLLKPKPFTVSRAQRHLKSAKENLELAMRVSAEAEAFSQHLGGTNSPVSHTIHSSTDVLVQNLQSDIAISDSDLVLAGTVETADRCVQSYADEASAQEAMAVLNLSGIKQVVIRPPRPSGDGTGQPLYNLMVPRDQVATAAAELLRSQVYRVKNFGTAFSAFQAMKALQAQGVHATVRPMKAGASGTNQDRVFIVFVLLHDAQKAQRILGGVTNGH